jgi:hypothetical protein
MSKELVIFARRHGSKTKELVSGPEVPIHKQRALFKEFLFVREHAAYDLVELSWVEPDRIRRLGPAGTAPVQEAISPLVAESLATLTPTPQAEAEVEAPAVPPTPAAPVTKSVSKGKKKNEK